MCDGNSFHSSAACFSKVPKTFRDLKAICESANRFFWKADLLACFQGSKTQTVCEISPLKSSLSWDTEGTVTPENGP